MKIKTKQIKDFSTSTTSVVNSLSIDALNDVDTTTSTPTSAQVLSWNNTQNKWLPTSINSFTVSSGNRSVSTNSNLTANDSINVYVAIANCTLTLPTPSSANVSKQIIVKSYTTSEVTITSQSGSQIIYDSTSPSTSVIHTANFPGFSTTFICLEIGTGTYYWVAI